MHPAFLDNMSWEMAEVYGSIVDQILINLARHFPFYMAGESVPKSAFAYQAAMLAQMGQVNKETVRIIRNGLSDADMALTGVLEQAIIDAVRTSEPELLEGVKKGVFAMPTTPILAPNQMRAFKLYYTQAADKMNLVNTVMLESTQSAYQQAVTGIVNEIELADRMARTYTAIDTAAGETITGVSSWNAALKHATDRLKEGGITGFVDHAGHQWSAEAYVAMDIRTTVFNTGRAAVWETNQTFGNDLYLVSYHNGARPLCFPWQNKVISSTDNARVTYDLDGNEIQVIAQSDTSYGQAAGLFGINCKHYPSPFIPGVSLADGTPQNKEDNDRVYAESQEQRRLERKLREEKRDLLMDKAQGASEEQLAAQRAKIKKSSEDIEEFCKETGRARHRDREAVYTKREFPDKERYDVTQFANEQKKLIDDYYKNGGAQQEFTTGQLQPIKQVEQAAQATNSATTVIAESADATNTTGFVPAKTIDEAQEFAKGFVDENTFGSVGISYDGVSLETANIVNRKLSEFYKEYDVDMFGGIIAPKGNTKHGQLLGSSHAGYVPIRKSIFINRKSMKDPKTLAKALEKERTLVQGYLKDPTKYNITDDLVKRVLDASATSGRATVPVSMEEVIDHELGHVLENKLKALANFDTIKKNWSIYGEKVSGYAAVEFDEYLAESFASWRKGETVTDPLLIEAFGKVKR